MENVQMAISPFKHFYFSIVYKKSKFDNNL